MAKDQWTYNCKCHRRCNKTEPKIVFHEQLTFTMIGFHCRLVKVPHKESVSSSIAWPEPFIFLSSREDETKHMDAIKEPIMSKVMKSNNRIIFWLLMQLYKTQHVDRVSCKRTPVWPRSAAGICVTFMYNSVNSGAGYISLCMEHFRGCVSLWQEVSAQQFVSVPWSRRAGEEAAAEKWTPVGGTSPLEFTLPLGLFY